jgi:predicted nucleic acid-binding protein
MGDIPPLTRFSERIRWLIQRNTRFVAVAIGQQIVANPTSNPTYLIIESDKEPAEAVERFAKQPSPVSFTDCIVMALADRLGT